MPRLTSVGLDVPSDFPQAAYESVNKRAAAKKSQHYSLFAGGWNAVAYRFVMANDANIAFAKAFAAGGRMPPAPERQVQEEALFTFFSASYAVIDSAFFALHGLLAIIGSSGIQVDDAAQRKVGPKSVVQELNRLFPNTPSLPLLSAVLANPKLDDLQYLRNVLNHRAIPGRNAFMGGDKHGKAEWSLRGTVEIDASLTGDFRSYLGAATTDIVSAIEGFALRNL